jgi:hypothetical protein
MDDAVSGKRKQETLAMDQAVGKIRKAPRENCVKELEREIEETELKLSTMKQRLSQMQDASDAPSGHACLATSWGASTASPGEAGVLSKTHFQLLDDIDTTLGLKRSLTNEQYHFAVYNPELLQQDPHPLLFDDEEAISLWPCLPIPVYKS